MAKNKDESEFSDLEIGAFIGDPDNLFDDEKISIPPPSRQIVAKRMMLPFEAEHEDSGDRPHGLGVGYTRRFTSHPQVLFKPKGLMIWGAPDDADVDQIWIGKNLQVVAALGPIPAKWFSMAQSYEQIEKALADNIEPPSWPDFETVQVAQIVKVNIRSQQKLPPIKLVMWGLGVQ